MIWRTFEAAEVNPFLNAPEIRPTIEGEGDLDASALLLDRRNICLIGESGGAMFAWHGPGIYEAHNFFLCRGRDALVLGKELLKRMFEEHGAKMVWGSTPERLRHARWYNRKIGFQSLGVSDGKELFVMEALCPSVQ